ncbi:hypothetical protein CCANI_09610 [Corynebacterium canis]|uniref:hypothetical protein n=1 Tax=Corynebacterium canis TaxID=679663 RepID=UPI00164694A2|nr:hypothetical protein [Corynebacterium canis]WJY75750.1 hypothetical protein CCANI_09610 [Corynebacterium canis]
MLIAAVLVALVALVLLVIAVQAESDIWSYLLILVAGIGFVLWIWDVIRTRR